MINQLCPPLSSTQEYHVLQSRSNPPSINAFSAPLSSRDRPRTEVTSKFSISHQPHMTSLRHFQLQLHFFLNLKLSVKKEKLPVISHCSYHLSFRFPQSRFCSFCQPDNGFLPSIRRRRHRPGHRSRPDRPASIPTPGSTCLDVVVVVVTIHIHRQADLFLGRLWVRVRLESELRPRCIPRFRTCGRHAGRGLESQIYRSRGRFARRRRRRSDIGFTGC